MYSIAEKVSTVIIRSEESGNAPQAHKIFLLKNFRKSKNKDNISDGEITLIQSIRLFNKPLLFIK